MRLNGSRLLVTSWLLAAPLAAEANFGDPSGQVDVRAGIQAETKPLDGYSPISASKTSFGGSFDVATASVAPALVSSTEVRYVLSAVAGTDTAAVGEEPRAEAMAAFHQPFTLSSQKRVFVIAEVKSLSDGQSQARVRVDAQNGIGSFSLGDTNGATVGRSAILPPGQHTLNVTAGARAFTVDPNGHTGTADGRMLITFEADIDGNQRVDADDRLAWEHVLGTNPPYSPNGDLNGDLRANGEDLLLWQRQFRGPPPARGAASFHLVPEPHTALAAWVAALMPFLSRQRSGSKCG
jgi:hypothetical protein